MSFPPKPVSQNFSQPHHRGSLLWQWGPLCSSPRALLSVQENHFVCLQFFSFWVCFLVWHFVCFCSRALWVMENLVHTMIDPFHWVLSIAVFWTGCYFHLEQNLLVTSSSLPSKVDNALEDLLPVVKEMSPDFWTLFHFYCWRITLRMLSVAAVEFSAPTNFSNLYLSLDGRRITVRKNLLGVWNEMWKHKGNLSYGKDL